MKMFSRGPPGKTREAGVQENAMMLQKSAVLQQRTARLQKGLKIQRSAGAPRSLGSLRGKAGEINKDVEREFAGAISALAADKLQQSRGALFS